MHLALSKFWRINRPSLATFLKKFLPGPWTLILLIAGLLMGLVVKAILL